MPMNNKTSNEVIHFYAGWCGKVLCAARGSPISSIKADDVTCEACNTMLMPARLLQPCVVDGDELAKIEDGWGDPAGTYLKYRGQVWINDGWLDNSKVRALRDWLNSMLSDDSSAPVAAPPGPPWEFDRYVNGRLKAEGIKINRALTFEQAVLAAVELAGPHDVLVPRQSAVETPKDAPTSKYDNAMKVLREVLRLWPTDRDFNCIEDGDKLVAEHFAQETE